MMETMRKLVVPVAVLLVLAAALSASVFADEWPWSVPLGTPSPRGETSGDQVEAVGATTVSVSPAATTQAVGTTFEVAVRIEGAENLGGYHFDMSYDPAVVEVLDVEDGGFIVQEGQSVFKVGPVYPVTGTVSFNAGAYPPADQGVAGNGVLAVVHLKAMQLGTSALDLSGVDLYLVGSDDPVPPDATEDGTVDVVPCQAASISAVEVTPEPAEVGEAATFDADVAGTAPITYTWDYGDETATESGVGMDVVTHTYDAIGTYTTTLTVENGCGSDQEQVPVTVEQACDLEIVSLTVTPEQADVGEEVAFDAEVAGTTPITYTWDYGDGTAPEVGVGRDAVTHAYTEGGSYTVTLTVENVCGVEEQQASVAVGENKIFLPVLLKNL